MDGKAPSDIMGICPAGDKLLPFIPTTLHYNRAMKLYVSNDCPACKLLYSLPGIHRVTIRNVDNDPSAAREFLELKLRVVPTLVHGNVIKVGAADIRRYL